MVTLKVFKEKTLLIKIVQHSLGRIVRPIACEPVFLTFSKLESKRDCKSCKSLKIAQTLKSCKLCKLSRKVQEKCKDTTFRKLTSRRIF